MREQACFVVSNNEHLDDYWAHVDLQLCLFRRDFWVYEHAVNQLIQHSFSVTELSQQVVVVYLVLCLLLESLNYSYSLEKSSQ